MEIEVYCRGEESVVRHTFHLDNNEVTTSVIHSVLNELNGQASSAEMEVIWSEESIE